MNNLEELIKLLDKAKSTEEDMSYFNMINNIFYYIQMNDIANGQRYLESLLQDKDIDNNTKKVENIAMLINKSPYEIFIENCKSVIMAIADTMLQKKTKGKIKENLPQKFQSIASLIEFYKDKI